MKEDKNEELLGKLNRLLVKQRMLSQEVEQLKNAVYKQTEESEVTDYTGQVKQEPKPVIEEVTTNTLEESVEHEKPVEVLSSNMVSKTLESTTQEYHQSKQGYQTNQPEGFEKKQSILEKFIGENLLNKVGILLTVIGVAIGAKYSIDNNLISPLVRILMGYAAGGILLGVGLRLKKKYHGYSAVLVSGAMAIMYFITYFAFTFYALVPASVAFGLMLLFTVFTVTAAIKYNLQVIAHIGLVGAYAIPFLLSDGSGSALVLFSYMTIINVGILVLAFKKYWKQLYYSSFGLTWLIYLSWYAIEYNSDKHFGVFFVFLFLLFSIFYGMFLANKIRLNKKFQIDDIALIIANAFLFYGAGYMLFESTKPADEFLGFFTVFCSLLHLAVAGFVHRKNLQDINLFYTVLGLSIAFITIAIPVQLDGSWVAVLWASEAALLFWVGRTMHGGFYEKLAYPMMVLSVGSLLEDWEGTYHITGNGNYKMLVEPILNLTFLSSVLVTGFFGFINYINRSKKYVSELKGKDFNQVVSVFVSAAFVGLVYATIRLELDNYWNVLFKESVIDEFRSNSTFSSDIENWDLLKFKKAWSLIYSVVFVSILSIINVKWIRNKLFGVVITIASVFVLLSFLIGGLFELSELRDSYLNYIQGSPFEPGVMHLVLRYIAILSIAGLLTTLVRIIRHPFMDLQGAKYVGLLVHISILWIASSEMIHWMDMAHSTQSYGLGLSILWGCYSLFLVSVGIWKKRQEFRILGIAIFGITLVKLFIYDMSDLNTIAKTIVFVSLGVLLLVISFLYNKFKHLISGGDESKRPIT